MFIPETIKTSTTRLPQITKSEPKSLQSKENRYYWKIKSYDNSEQIVRIENLSHNHVKSIYGYIKKTLHEGHMMGHEREDWLKRLRYEPKRRKIEELRNFDRLSKIFHRGSLPNIFNTIKHDIKKELNEKNYEPVKNETF